MALSKVNVVLEKIRVTLIVACLELKLIACRKANELQRLVKRSGQALKEKLLSLIQRLQKLRK